MLHLDADPPTQPDSGPDGAPGATAYVVLGCRPDRPDLRGAALRRVVACAKAYFDEADPTRDLVLCAGGRAWGGFVEADAFAAALSARGVPTLRIVRERCSMTTGENARYAASLLGRRGISRVRLVTCAWHMPRAAAHFRRVGLSVVEVPVEAPGGALVGSVRRAREGMATWLDGLVA